MVWHILFQNTGSTKDKVFVKDGITLTKCKEYLVCKDSIFTFQTAEVTVLSFHYFVNFFDLCVKWLDSLPTFC